MKERPLLIHIGYHKTGTTWLQRVLFQPQNGYRQILSHDEVFEYVIRPHGLRFDPSVAKSHINQRSSCGTGCDIDVISSENLSGNPFFGGRDSDEYARRLHGIAPEASILVSIRGQVSMMVSIYMQYLSRGGTMTPREFFEARTVPGYFFFDPEHLEYHRLIGYYRCLFGPNKVLVISQEQLGADPVAVGRMIARFSGNARSVDPDTVVNRRVGASVPEYAYPLLRLINHFRTGPMNLHPMVNLGPMSDLAYRAVGKVAGKQFLKARFGRSHPVRDYVENQFGDRFDESNRKLKEMLYPKDVLIGVKYDRAFR